MKKDEWSSVRMSNGLFLEMIYLKMRETKTDVQMLKPSVISEVVRIRLQKDESSRTPKNIRCWRNFVKENFTERLGKECMKFDDFVEQHQIPDRFLKELK
jgi:hypothetical protein